MDYLVPALIGYLIGSIPFGLLLTKAAGLGDIRKIGSGNIGATNVLRTGNKKLAIATLLLDGSKGGVAIILTSYLLYGKIFLMPSYPGAEVNDQVFLTLVAGLSAVVGHCYPVWLKFKGGKGVATSLGTFLIGLPAVGILACITWLITARISKTSSLSAIVALSASWFFALLSYDDSSSWNIVFLIAVLVIFKHKDNIRRLLKGEEPKISFKKKADNAE